MVECGRGLGGPEEMVQTDESITMLDSLRRECIQTKKFPGLKRETNRESTRPIDGRPPKNDPRRIKPLKDYFQKLGTTPAEASPETSRVLRSQANPVLGPSLGTQELFQDILFDNIPTLPRDFILQDTIPGRVI